MNGSTRRVKAALGWFVLRHGPSHPTRGQATNDSAKATIRRKFDELSANWNLAVLDVLVDDDVVAHDPSFGDPVRGKDAYRAAAAQFATAFPEIRFTIEDQVAEGDTVVTLWSAVGRHGGDLFGTPSTGKQVSFTGVDIHRVRDGKIIEERGQWDALGLLRQIGAIPVSDVDASSP